MHDFGNQAPCNLEACSLTCPLCQSDSRIIDTRKDSRRRECESCRHRWTTVEIPAARKDALERVEQAVRDAAKAIA